jgi:hypothetical protein
MGGGGRSSDPSSPPVLDIICTNISQYNLYLYAYIFEVDILEKHPDLAGKLADANLLTPESTR